MYSTSSSQNNFFFETQASDTLLEQKKSHLVKSLTTEFPISDLGLHFGFLFSNEMNYYSILTELNAKKTTKNNQTKVALLFGESNLISMLPELSKHVDVIITADIDKLPLKNVQLLLECLKISESPNEFKINYIKNFKTIPDKSPQDYELLDSELRKMSLKDYFFLDNLPRFIECKKAAEKLIFAGIQLDLLDSERCDHLSNILAEQDATIALCNFTNIHEYGGKDDIKNSALYLLKNSPDCLVMHSDFSKLSPTPRETCINEGLESYFSSALGFNLETERSQFKIFSSIALSK